MGAYVAAELEDGGEVYLEHGVPVGVGELVRWVPLLNAAAVEQDVDSVAVGEDGGDELGDGGRGGEVGDVDCGFSSEGFDGLLGGLVGSVALDEEDVCACFCEGEGHGLADSSRATCYEGGLALEGEELLYGGHVGCNLAELLNCGVSE